MSNKKYINLNVEGTNLDLPDKELNIELTLRNPCSDGFGEISGSESKRSFRLPATKTNDAAFENWWDVSLQNSSSAPLEKDAFIEVNGLRVLSGKAQLKEVTTVGRFYERQGKDYQVSLVGDNADWFSLLEDLELGRDLDWSAQLHNLTNAEVTAGYNAAPADIYGYAVLKFQDWANIDKVDVYESTLFCLSEKCWKRFSTLSVTSLLLVSFLMWLLNVTCCLLLSTLGNIRRNSQTII